MKAREGPDMNVSTKDYSGTVRYGSKDPFEPSSVYVPRASYHDKHADEDTIVALSRTAKASWIICSRKLNRDVGTQPGVVTW